MNSKKTAEKKQKKIPNFISGSQKPINSSIKSVLISRFLILGILPIIVLSLVSFYIFGKSLFKAKIDELYQIVNLSAKTIDGWGEDKILLTEELVTGPLKSGNPEIIKEQLKNKQKENIDLINCMYIDANGNILADSLGSIDENIAFEPYFNEVTKQYTSISSIHMDKDGTPYIAMGSPEKKDGKITGYIVIKIKIESIQDKLGKLSFTQNGSILVFNELGSVTYSNDFSKINTENLLEVSPDMQTIVTNSIKGISSYMPSIQYNGQKQAASYSFIQSLKWGFCATVPTTEIFSIFTTLLALIAVLSVFLILIIIAAGIQVAKKFSVPILSLASLTKNVAEGNLTNECTIKGTSEINSIGSDFNEMVKSLKNLVIKIQQENSNLSSASTSLKDSSLSAEQTSRDIAKAMSEITQSSVTQADKTDNILNQVKILDGKVSELTNQLSEINKALSLSQEALEFGNKGTTELKNNTQNQYKIVGETVQEVKELSDSVANIDKIIITISDIAEQTNLLALNASIEAAGAGESGKGFAVVADEVSQLATQSQDATNEIASILNNIKIKAEKTTNLMNTINKGMEIQEATVNETLTIFTSISSADDKITESVAAFNTVNSFIKDFSAGLFELVEALASASEENAAVAQEVTSSSESQLTVVENVKTHSENISKIVNELNENIKKFQTA